MASEIFHFVRQLLVELPDEQELQEVDRRIARLSLKLVRERSAEVPKEQRPDEAWIRMTAKSNILKTARGKLIGGILNQSGRLERSGIDGGLDSITAKTGTVTPSCHKQISVSNHC